MLLFAVCRNTTVTYKYGICTDSIAMVFVRHSNAVFHGKSGPLSLASMLLCIL